MEIKTVFIGSGEFAAVVLGELLKFELLDIAAVITQPDKPAGRDQELQAPPVKELLHTYQYEGKLYQPEQIRTEAEELMAETLPELIIVADYGQILPEHIIDFPKYKCLNVHASLLPGLRGAVPINAAILKGYKETGVSIPIMTAGLDDGPVIASAKLQIMPADNAASLKNKLALLGADLLKQILPKWVKDEVEAQEQDHDKATYVNQDLIAKEKAQFNRYTSVEEADRMVRGLYPWPIAWTQVMYNDKELRLKVFAAETVVSPQGAEPGIISREGKDLLLHLEDGSLKLLELQLEGKERREAGDYLYLDGTELAAA